MIELITGLPGNSKTLFSIRHLIDRASQENRAVYYAGLKEFKADDPRLKGTTWLEFDPLTWHDTVPSGALIFIDEAQTVFRARSLGTVPQKHVTELEQHRHKGLDFVLVTQHPSLIDPAIRRLAQSHRHLIRIWGYEASTVHFWDGVKDNPEKAGPKRESQKTKWAFDKSLYGIYKSADVHTMKKQIPLRVKLLALVPVVLVACGYFAYRSVKSVAPSTLPAPAASSSSTSNGFVAAPAGAPAPSTKRPADPVEDLKDYLWQQTPRVSGLPQTAPKYDALTAPVRVPVPAACIQVGDLQKTASIKCKCYTQQGTPMEVEYNMCIQFAQHGFFQEFDADRDRAAQERSKPLSAPAPVEAAPRPVQVASAAPQLPQVDLGPSVYVMSVPRTLESSRSTASDKPINDGLLPSRVAFAPAPNNAR